jgi:hypothetical protein
MKNKTLPISQLGAFQTNVENSHNNKHAATGYTIDIARFR